MEEESSGKLSDTKLVGRMALNDNKAGMKGLDKEKINRIIMENTVGSRYYKNEQKRDKQVQERIQKMKERSKCFSSQQRKEALQKADEILASVEKERDLSRTIIHIDMDAFYASVEERDRPELKEKPMAVGGMDMLSTSNYMARRFGVRAAMPGFIAKKLCPELIIVPLNFDKYKKVSQECQSIFADYDCNFMAMSLDEAYLDITEHLEKRVLLSEKKRTFSFNAELLNGSNTNASEHPTKTFGFSAQDVSEELRFRIHQKTLLTASAGIAPNTMLAKIGSDLNKPNGQTYFRPDRDSIMEFIRALSIRKVSGIGKVSEQLLAALDVKTCGDLYERRADLFLLFSNISCNFFFRTALGCSSSRLEGDSERKSISTERTFNTISDPVKLYLKLEELCETLVGDIKKKNVQGKTVVLKIKTVDFESRTRSRSINSGIQTKDEILCIGKDLLKLEIANAKGKLALRLMGIGISKLEAASSAQQVSIRSFFTGRKNNNASTSSIDTVDLLAEVSDASNDATAIFKDTETSCEKEEEISSEKKTANFENCDLVIKCATQSTSKTDSCNITDKETKPDSIDVGDRSAKTRLFEEDMTCPLCQVTFSASEFTLGQFNLHIDSCLSRREIKNILQSESNNNQPLSRKLSPKKSAPSKRRKIASNQFHKIDKFFS
uniref:DNA polymerase kappa n=1 Tax=Phallusia mammillata TaxID=59560 RepID=A0A6F9DPE6_9ASCI|nr:DNA polymerase kappa-like [Phallusia mammillata]